MNKIQVFRKSDNKIIAGDTGENVTIESLKGKMIHKLDITDENLYEIVEKDISNDIKLDKIKKERMNEYPSATNQLDAIWKQFEKMKKDGLVLHGDAENMLNSILAVKEKHPK